MSMTGQSGAEERRPVSPVPTLILFDLDDTLCDYAAARRQRLQIAFSLGHGGNNPSPAHLERMVSESVEMRAHGSDHFPDLFRRHGIGDPAGLAEAIDWYRRNQLHGLGLFPDAIATINALRGATMVGNATPVRRIGLVTNGPRDIQRSKIDWLKIGGLVDFSIISEEFGVWKPDPEIFQEALRLGGATTDETVFVGDSPEHDIAGARAAHIRTIWINRARRAWSEPTFCPDYEIDQLSALVPLLVPEVGETPPLR